SSAPACGGATWWRTAAGLSQLVAAGPLKTAPSPRATAMILPVRSVRAVRPCVVMVRCKRRSAGLAAARALAMLKVILTPPSVVAVRLKLTPGSASRYVAVPPRITGALSLPGKVSDTLPCGLLIVTSGPVPPAENASRDGTAAGDQPERVRINLVLIGTHRPPTLVRTGSA